MLKAHTWTSGVWGTKCCQSLLPRPRSLEALQVTGRGGAGQRQNLLKGLAFHPAIPWSLSQACRALGISLACSGSPAHTAPHLPSSTCCTVGKSFLMPRSTSFYSRCSLGPFIFPSVWGGDPPLGDGDLVPSPAPRTQSATLSPP